MRCFSGVLVGLALAGCLDGEERVEAWEEAHPEEEAAPVDAPDTAAPPDTGQEAEFGCEETAVVYPGAPELCDGLDNDCDGSVDEEKPTWYPDLDADGYGDGAQPFADCAAPAGWVAQPGDCDDADARYHPGAEEVCTDPADYNCDGVSLAADGDLDGAWACEDCDDADPSVSPYEAEWCDGVDTNCNGEIDEDAEDASTFYPDEDGDGTGWVYGESVSSCEDSVPGYADNANDCDDAEPLAYYFAAEVCGDDVDNDCDADEADCERVGSLALDGADLDLYGEGLGAAAGWAVAGVGDTDGDGLDDVMVGSPSDSGGDSAAYLVLGGAGGELDLADDSDGTIAAKSDDAYLGAAIAGGGDVDGDGYDDVLLGAPGDVDYIFSTGAVYLFTGPFGGSLTTSNAVAEFTTLNRQSLGYSVAIIGDVNGGQDDVALGTYDGDAVYLFFGGSSWVDADVDEDADAIVYSSSDDQAGSSLAGQGDVDGDGREDLLVGAPAADAAAEDAGAAYLLLDPAGTSSFEDAEAIFKGSSAGDQLGYAVHLADDTDGDGYADLLISESDAGGGAVYLVPGPVTGASMITSVDTASFLNMTGAVSTGDFDGDGLSDVLVGDADNTSSGADAGAAFIFYGVPSGFYGAHSSGSADLTLLGEAAGDKAGSAVASAGDLDGDGHDDALVGAPSHSYRAGAAYLLLGDGI